MCMQSYCEGKNRKSRPFIELKREEQKAIIHCETVKGRTEWREEQKAITLRGIGKGRTEKPWPYIKPMSLYEIEKGRTAEQKNRNPIPYVSNESVKGRTETRNPCTHIPMWKHWNYEGKNRNPWPYITDDSMKGKNRNPIPMYPYTYVSMKGRTETQDPILAMNLRKGRTETQNPCTLGRKKKKPMN